MIRVSRPKASKSKISTSDDFELCYIRHQYFRRVKYNPTEADMQPYMYIVANLSKNTFFTYFNLFKAVGMYYEDVLNIGRVHLVSFLGLYSLEKCKDKKKAFIDTFERYNYKEPEEKDFDQKNKANFTMFFKQRMEDLVRVCRQKVRNIKGQPLEEFVAFCGISEIPKNRKDLIKNYEELGFKKIEFSILRSIRKKAKVGNDVNVFEFNGLQYIVVALEQKCLDLDDIVGAGYNPYENAHNMRPDDLLFEKENDGLLNLFNSKSDYRKKVVLKNFIAKNRNKSQYKEEIQAAKKLLRGLGE